MPDQDNVALEKVSLSMNDFSEDLGNDFGIQDTQLLANKDLQSFLLSDPDDVKSTEDEKEKNIPPKQEDQSKKTPQNQQSQQSDDDDEGQNNPPKKKIPAKKDDEDGKKALEHLLYGEEDPANEDEQGTNDTKQKPPASVTGTEEEDTYSTLSKDLLRLGVFTKNSEDESEENIAVKTPEEFLERFSLEKKKGAIGILDNFLSQFGEDYRKMFDAVFVNGVKPQEYLQSFTKIETLGQIDLATELNQERVVRAYYKGLKWDDNKIDTRIQKLKDYGDLEDEAKTYHEVLLNREKETAAALEAKKLEDIQKAKEKETAQKKSYTRILTEKLKAQEIDGIPLNDKEAQATLEYLTNKKYKLESGELLSEFDKDLLELNRPENHELKVKLGLLLRKKLDLTSVKKTTISKKSDALFTLSTKNAKQNSKEKEIKSFF